MSPTEMEDKNGSGLFGAALVTLLIGGSLGATLGLLFHSSAIGDLLANNLDDSQRYRVIAWVLATAVLAVVGYLAAHRLLFCRMSIPLAQTFRTLNRYGIIALALPFAQFSFSGGAKLGPFFLLFSCAAVGVIVVVFSYHVARRWSPPIDRLPRREWIAAGAVLAIVVGYAVVLSSFHIAHHRNLQTATWDLGLYLNMLWRTSQGDPWACSLLTSGTGLTTHFEPILLLLSPLMWISPRAETLIIFQSVWIALGAIPLYLATVHRLGRRWLGFVVCLLYLLHPAVHGYNMFDFHTLSLAAPVVFWCIFFLDTGRIGLFYAALSVLLSLREDMPLLACFIGLYAMVHHRRRWTGIVTIAVSMAYFIVVKVFVLTDVFEYASYFTEMQLEGRSIYSSILLSMLSNPLWVLRHALAEEKIIYLLQLAIPMLGLPLISRGKRILLVYGAALTLLATKPAVYSIAFQYSNLLLPFMLIALPDAIGRVSESGLAQKLGLESRAVVAALAMGMLASTAAVSAHYGVLVPNDAFSGGNNAFDRNPDDSVLERYRTVERIRELLPSGDSVHATGRLTPHFADRTDLWQFKKRLKKGDEADWVVAWDRELRNKEQRKRMDRLLASPNYETVIEEHGLIVLKRVGRSVSN